MGTGKNRSPGRTWNQPTCQADSDSLSALCFDKTINKVEATAQSGSTLALAHRAIPSPGSICSQLLGLKGRQEDYSWSIRRAVQMLLMLQRAKLTPSLGNAKCATILTTQSKEREKKNLSWKLWEKVQKVCCREKFTCFRLRGNRNNKYLKSQTPQRRKTMDTV